MRLYRQHDLDLIYLYKIKGFSFQKHMKAALHAYLKNEPYIIEVPQGVEEMTLPKSIQFHLCLSEDKDADIIAWLKILSNGYRNSLLKNMFRGYLNTPVVIPYLKNSETSFEKNFVSSIFKRTKKESAKTEKELVEEVLNTSLPTSNPNFKPDIIKEVLSNENPENEKPTISNIEKDNQEHNSLSINNNPSIGNNPEEGNDINDVDDFDFFGEFDSMINKF